MLNFYIQFYHFLLIALGLVIILIGMGVILRSIFNSVHLTLNFRAIYKKFKYYNFMKGKVILKSKYKTLRSVLLKEFTIKKILKLLLFSILHKIFIFFNFFLFFECKNRKNLKKLYRI